MLKANGSPQSPESKITELSTPKRSRVLQNPTDTPISTKLYKSRDLQSRICGGTPMSHTTLPFPVSPLLSYELSPFSATRRSKTLPKPLSATPSRNATIIDAERSCPRSPCGNTPSSGTAQDKQETWTPCQSKVLTPMCRHTDIGGVLTPQTIKSIGSSIARHHIIPRHLGSNSYFSDNFRLIDFNLDDQKNIIMLPHLRVVDEKIAEFRTPTFGTSLGERCSTGSIHSGRHSSHYVAMIRENLQQIFDSDDTAALKKRQLLKFLTTTRLHLADGSLELGHSGGKLRAADKSGSCNSNIGVEHCATACRGLCEFHHIIPRELFRNRKIASELANVNFFENCQQNLILLPRSEAISKSHGDIVTPAHGRQLGGRSVHSGNHPRYTSSISDSLAVVRASGLTGERVAKLVSDTEEKLLSGELRLAESSN
jgi:hypothetical protein